MTTLARRIDALVVLEAARNKLYSISGGSIDSGDVRAASISTAQRIEYFNSPEFRAWLAAEKAAGRQVIWCKDVDKTQAAGDIFTFYFDWRSANGAFSQKQLEVIQQFLRKQNVAVSLEDGPSEVVRLWLNREEGGEGIEIVDFWREVYWPSQIGISREEKQAQVKAFAEYYSTRVYPLVPEENRLLDELGVHVVIVSNGDQELAIAAGAVLGIRPENVVGSNLLYGADGLSTGVNHSYELFDGFWANRPQPGKQFSFHYWLHANRARFGWTRISEQHFTIAGRDGDSASADGGMMMLGQTVALGNFIVDTPDEPKRREKFLAVADRYGWTPGQFFTLKQLASKCGNLPK